MFWEDLSSVINLDHPSAVVGRTRNVFEHGLVSVPFEQDVQIAVGCIIGIFTETSLTNAVYFVVSRA